MTIRTHTINPFDGISLIPDPFQAEFIIKPERTHEKKRWMTGQYHRRIQKKWNKRFGMKKERQMFQVGDRVFAHPNTIEYIKQEMKRGRCR